MVLRTLLPSCPPVKIISSDLEKLKRMISFYRKGTLYSPELRLSSPLSGRAVWQ